MNNKNNNQEKYKNLLCPHCKSLEVVRRGTFETKAHGEQQRFFCKKCSKKFIVRTAFYRMRNDEKKITLCLDLFYRGVSTRKVQEHLQAFYPHNSSWVSIYSWVVKYSKQISKFTDNLKLQVGEEVQIDEVEYKRRKSHKKGSKGTMDNFFIDSIDTTTRFMVASNYVNARGNKELKEVAVSIRKKTGEQIKMVTTDGLLNYENIIKNVWGYDNHLGKYKVFYKKVVTSKEEVFNYPIERLHNNIRARTKIFRGFHGSVKSANAIMKGYSIFYNFITKHQAIDCCPYELAIPELNDKLNVPNKWLALIQLANKSI